MSHHNKGLASPSSLLKFKALTHSNSQSATRAISITFICQGPSTKNIYLIQRDIMAVGAEYVLEDDNAHLKQVYVRFQRQSSSNE